MSTLAAGVSSGAKCYIMARTAQVEKGQARGGLYIWMVHCGHARRTRDACSTPRTMSAARTNAIALGATMSRSAGAQWWPLMCRATSVCLEGVTRWMASWMFTLRRAVSS